MMPQKAKSCLTLLLACWAPTARCAVPVDFIAVKPAANAFSSALLEMARISVSDRFAPEGKLTSAADSAAKALVQIEKIKAMDENERERDTSKKNRNKISILQKFKKALLESCRSKEWPVENTSSSTHLVRGLLLTLKENFSQVDGGKDSEVTRKLDEALKALYPSETDSDDEEGKSPPPATSRNGGNAVESPRGGQLGLARPVRIGFAILAGLALAMEGATGVGSSMMMSPALKAKLQQSKPMPSWQTSEMLDRGGNPMTMKEGHGLHAFSLSLGYEIHNGHLNGMELGNWAKNFATQVEEAGRDLKNKPGGGGFHLSQPATGACSVVRQRLADDAANVLVRGLLPEISEREEATANKLESMLGMLSPDMRGKVRSLSQDNKGAVEKLEAHAQVLAEMSNQELGRRECRKTQSLLEDMARDIRALQEELGDPEGEQAEASRSDPASFLDGGRASPEGCASPGACTASTHVEDAAGSYVQLSEGARDFLAAENHNQEPLATSEHQGEAATLEHQEEPGAVQDFSATEEIRASVAGASAPEQNRDAAHFITL
mmetsp:Transcript_27362/g.69007  ORF Transcript_27362/g.69007 Transcript_27362/m.69007 type:complete len:551 (-) Transcript_27362:1141-2793(-)